MSDCPHVKLIKQVGPMDRGWERYRCQACNEFFIVELKPDVIGVSFGKPKP